MHEARNRQGHVWLLAGTGEGPLIAATLLAKGWQVSVSVVSSSAATVYDGLPLRHLWIGALAGPQAIRGLLERYGIDRVVDATHPFATRITAQLLEACGGKGPSLLRFERPIETLDGARLIEDVDALKGSAGGRRILLALGARNLPAVVAALKPCGHHVHARVLPSPLALRQALAAGLPAQCLAVHRPQQGGDGASLEAALCRYWAITDVLCRQSGGITERAWHRVTQQQGLQLWLLRRPPLPEQLETVHSVDQLLDRLC